MHVTDGDRGSLEAYLESVERLLEEQDQELERCVVEKIVVVWVRCL